MSELTDLPTEQKSQKKSSKSCLVMHNFGTGKGKSTPCSSLSPILPVIILASVARVHKLHIRVCGGINSTVSAVHTLGSTAEAVGQPVHPHSLCAASKRTIAAEVAVNQLVRQTSTPLQF